MKHNQIGLFLASIGLLLGLFSFELGKYIHHSIGYFGVLLSFILTLVGIIFIFKDLKEYRKK